jgi:acyl-CoA reductase-like NAD-dependent aldehyde dehydrogenase
VIAAFSPTLLSIQRSRVPDGVINVLDVQMITDNVLASRDFAGLHFTGSTHVFKDIWAKIEPTFTTLKTYPRIVEKLRKIYYRSLWC